MEKANDLRHKDALIEIRGLVSDLLRQLLSSCITFEDMLMEKGNIKYDLLHSNEQLTCAIKTLFKVRSILMFYTNV